MAATKQKIESMMIQLLADAFYPKVQYSDVEFGKCKTLNISDKINKCDYYVDFIHNDESIDIVGASVLIDGVEDEGLSFDLKYAVMEMIDNKAIAGLYNQSKQIKAEQLQEMY